MRKKLKILSYVMSILGVIFVIVGGLFRLYGLIPIGGYMVTKYCTDIYRNRNR